eukprot:PDM73785.1 haf-3 [Pristionchus pacificus]
MLSTLAARASTCLRCGTSSSAARSACFSTISGTTRRKMLQVGKKLLAQPAIRNVAVVDTKRASAKLGRSTWKDLRAIFKLAGPYKGRIILGLSFLGISSSVFLLTPRTLGKLIDEFDDTKKQEPGTEDATLLMARYFKEHPVALAGVLLIGAAAIAARVYCMHTAGQLIINDLRKKVFASVLKQDMKFFDKNKVGEIVSRLSTDALIVGYSVSMNLSDGARALVTCLGSGSLMVYTSPALCKVMFFVIPIMVGTFAVFGRLQRKYTLEMQDAVAAANQVATERLGSVKTVRMLVAEPKERAAYGAKIQNIWDISKKEGAAKGVMFGSFQFTGYMALSTILFYGSTLISKGLLTYGELSSFCLYAVLSAASLSNMSGFFVEIMKGLGASARLFELRDQKPMIPLVGGIKKENVEKEITFENVTFAYPDRDRLFSNISFQVPAGKITAVVGPSGSGKSTIASLMLRKMYPVLPCRTLVMLYEPDGGRILVDGVDLKDMDPSVWRRNIGTVGQEPVLFSTSIRENIVYGAEHPEQVTEAQIEEAAKQSNSWEFLRRFPDGLNTMVGEHGSTLSGGQKQRVAIARALVTNPRILILDEATSALDATSEYLVRVALNRLLENSQQTVLIIAHRLSTIKHADQIVVIDQGTVPSISVPTLIMRSIFVLLLLVATVAAGSVYSRYKSSSSEGGDEPDGDLWALIVAGSNGWFNYRHQADTAHAFHVLKAHGVPEENIITMMYDDIAHNPSNKYKGKLFNSPKYVDVYEGVKIDYKGDDVNAENFLNVLKGNSSGIKGGNGRVIESGPDDRVFVYFTDHGAVGLISFPNDILTTKSLNDALNWSNKNKRFADLVFYLEACESGSMFERVLPATINVYAVSAANGKESSWGTYCENDRGLPCLGDLFSVNWMEDSDVEDLTVETVGEQFKIVQKETNKSHVCHFGKMKTETDPLSWFQGAEKSVKHARRNGGLKSSLQHKLDTAVPSRDVETEHLKRQLAMTNDADEEEIIRDRLDEIQMKKATARRTMKSVVSVMYDDEADTLLENNKRRVFYMEKNDESSIVNYPECHHKVVHTYRRLCIANPAEDIAVIFFPFNFEKFQMEYAMPYVYVLNNLCNAEAGRSHDIMEAIIEQCLEKTLL